MKPILLVAPLAVAMSACATEDLEAFADGLNQFAYELDNQMNPPCPAGMYRQFIPETLATSYPRYPYQQVGYQMTPGGYSYCAYPLTTSYTDDHRDHDDHRGHHGDGGRHDDDYSEGYRDGYRDGHRED